MPFTIPTRASSGRPSANDIQSAVVPILGSPQYRSTDATKDQRFVNGIFEVVKSTETGAKKFFFLKRPGLVQNINPVVAGAVGRGVKVWNGNIYSVWGTKIYKGTTDLGVTLTTSTGLCGMEFTRPSATTPYLCVNDGVKLYRIDSSDVVTTVTTNFPNPNTTDLHYFDGYLFTITSTGIIRNCDLDDPATWDPTKFITAIMSNGSGIGLARQSNYLMYFSDRSMQTFYDNANPTGSPLFNLEQGMLQIGAASQNSIRSDEGEITWVGKSMTGGWGVFNLKGVSNPTDISTEPVKRLLHSEGSNLVNCRAKFMRTNGHKLYILDLMGANRTLVYDYDIDMWYEWQAAGATTRWPICAASELNGTQIVQHESNGWIYTLSNTAYRDDTTNFTVLARFGRQDFDTDINKFVTRAVLLSDQQATTAQATLQYSDDDFQTLSTARTLDMVDYRPYATNLGKYKRRAWQLSITNNMPARLEGIRLYYRLGVI